MDKHQKEKNEILKLNRLELSKIEASLLESRRRGVSLLGSGTNPNSA